MPPHGGPPRTPPTPYNAQFDATYSPDGLQTSSTWGGGYGRGGHGGGGYGYESESSFDPSALMDMVYNYKQRGADAALERQQKAERDARLVGRFQAQALRNNTPAETSKTRQFWANKRDLDTLRNPLSDYAGTQQLQTNPAFFNMPAASALTYGQDVFPNGWDQYAKMITPLGRK